MRGDTVAMIEHAPSKAAVVYTASLPSWFIVVAFPLRPNGPPTESGPERQLGWSLVEVHRTKGSKDMCIELGRPHETERDRTITQAYLENVISLHPGGLERTTCISL